MTEATIIDGKAIAMSIRKKIAEQVFVLKHKHHLTPGLAVIIVGEDPASQVYVKNKGQQVSEAGMNSFQFTLPAETTQKNLINKIESLNNDPKVHGILVQLPLPAHIDEKVILTTISPAKDVDGFHIQNVGKLVTGQKDALVPCTPVGCVLLIKHVLGKLSGKKAVIIGRSNIVGKPVAHLLLQENCTVTITHSKTRDLAAECRQADIVVAAVGIAELVKASWVKPGAVVIDVGINRVSVADGKTKLLGDVAFDEVKQVAGAITPVPGGVGPMTIACLLRNTVKAACDQHNIPVPEME
jgi:methylenetetrahydrofolate dehydrogenase (NADP+)/methenyltetrahydrofolate cyclohydrolase